MRILFLDDDPNRHQTFRYKTIGMDKTVVETPEEAFEALVREQFDIVSLDHDLEGKIYCPSDEKSGFAVCQFLNTMPSEILPNKVVLHSYNEEGVRNMRRELYELGRTIRVVTAPFDCDKFWEQFRG